MQTRDYELRWPVDVFREHVVSLLNSRNVSKDWDDPGPSSCCGTRSLRGRPCPISLRDWKTKAPRQVRHPLPAPRSSSAIW